MFTQNTHAYKINKCKTKVFKAKKKMELQTNENTSTKMKSTGANLYCSCGKQAMHGIYVTNIVLPEIVKQTGKKC